MKVLEVEKEQKGREVADLQTRLSLEEQREEEKGREVFTLKQKLKEAETTRDCLKKEVRVKRKIPSPVLYSLCCNSFVFAALRDSETPVGV